MPLRKKGHFLLQRLARSSRLLRKSPDMKTFLLSCILITLSCWEVYACSCTGPDQFIYPGTDQGIVVCVEKRYTQDHGMVVKVLNQISGPTIADEITVWGDVGHLCRAYVTGFEDKSQYILRLEAIPDPLPEYWGEYTSDKEAAGDYTLSICGLHYLEVAGGNVTAPWGTINGNDTEMKLSDFKAAMEGYRAIQVSINRDANSSIIIVTLLEDVADAGQIQIYDMRGRVVRQVAIRPEEELVYEIPFMDLSEGVYVMRIQAGQYFRTIKLAFSHP